MNVMDDVKWHESLVVGIMLLLAKTLLQTTHWGFSSGPVRVNPQEVVGSASPIFLKFYSNCHCPIWWTSAKFEWNLSRNGM